jgi:hypothetical protein
MLCHVTIGGCRRDTRFLVLCAVQGFITYSIVFNVVLLEAFLAPTHASYCFATSIPWSSLSQVVVPILLGVPK